MPAYCLFDNVDVTDLEKLDQYKTRVASVVQQHGGRYVTCQKATNVNIHNQLP